MSIQYDQLRAEMEVNRMLQNVIAAHHIIQVANLIVGMIFCGATSQWSLMIIHLTLILPTLVFVIFWIASKCNYHDLRLILVHFNFILSMLWFITVLPIFIMSIIFPMTRSYRRDSDKVDVAPTVVTIVNGILILSSISFAVCAIWKSARNVVLNAKLAKLNHFDGHGRSPFLFDTQNTFNDDNDIKMSQVPYVQLK